MKTETTDTVAFFGLPITNVTLGEAVARVEEQILSGGTHQVATADLDFARRALQDEYLHQVVCECSMVLPNGAPMLWASRMFGTRVKERIAGVDLVTELAKMSATRGYSIYLLGSSETSSRMSVDALERQFPGVRIVGRSSPEVKALHEMDHDAILERIEAAQPDILLVAFGNPTQEIWIHRHKGRLRVPVTIGIGGALDEIGGNLRRAPRWMRKCRMEWAFKVSVEPRLSLTRFARNAGALLLQLLVGLAAMGLQPGERRRGALKVEVKGTVRTVVTPCSLTGAVCSSLTKEARFAVLGSQTMVVDMSATTRVEADGLGALLEARRLLIGEGLWIWLAGMSNPVRRVLQFSAMSELFRIAATPDEALFFTANARSAPARTIAQGAAMSRSRQVATATIARAN